VVIPRRPQTQQNLKPKKEKMKTQNPTQEIETTCKELSNLRAQLSRRYETRLSALRALDEQHSPEINRLQERCGALRASLENLVEQARPCFARPKTREYHGITVGFEKARDAIAMPDETILVGRIEKMLPAAQGETVLDRSVRIIKQAFKKLPRETLQKLGCSFIAGADKVIVRAQAGDIEAIVQPTAATTITATSAPAPTPTTHWTTVKWQ